MGMIRFNGRRFTYKDDDGKEDLLLELDDLYGNHSSVSMNQHMDNYGQTQQDEPFRDALMKHMELFKGKRQPGYVLILLLILRGLFKKPCPVKVLRAGGSASDDFSVELAKILHAFHLDSLLCCLGKDMAAAPAENILSLPLEMKGLKLMQEQFSVILLDDMQGEVKPEMVTDLLPALLPWGRFFCLTANQELLSVCRKLLPEAKIMRAEGDFFLLFRECSGEELDRVRSLTHEGELARVKAEIGHRLSYLSMDVKRLEYLEEKGMRRMMQASKELELYLAEIYPDLASVDAKMLATQFREALIDWQLGTTGPKRVRDVFAVLQAELMRYSDIPGLR